MVDEVRPGASRASIAVEPTSTDPWFHLHVGDVAEYVGPDLDGCLDRLVWRLTQDAVAADDRVLVHAGGVADERGTAAVLVGTSGSGKTTLSVALARRGHRLLSDEVAVLDPDDLRVWPFLRPPGFEPDAVRLFPDLGLGEPGGWSRHVPVLAVSGDADSESPAEVGVIVVPVYEPGVPTCEVTELNDAGTLVALARSTPRLGELGQRALDCLATLAASVPGYHLRSGPIDEAASLVSDLLESSPSRPRQTGSDRWHPPTTATCEGEPGAWRCAARALSVRMGDDAVVVAGDGSTRLLNRTAASCWWALSGWRTVAGVVDEVAAEVGVDPATIAGDVVRLMADLESARLIEPFDLVGPGVDAPDRPGRSRR